MNTSYHIAGIASSFFFCLCFLGFFHQFGEVFRKKINRSNTTTFAISLNQISSSLLAFLFFAVYGASTTPFNHYVFWPRVIAVTFLLLILVAIFLDRKDRLSIFSLVGCLLMTIGGISIALSPVWRYEFKLHFQVLSALAVLMLAQGYIHQVYKIRKLGTTGVISLRMHQTLFLKDISGGIFGIVLGVKEGWPLALLMITAFIKGTVVWHFRWVKKSPIAKERRIQSRNDLS